MQGDDHRLVSQIWVPRWCPGLVPWGLSLAVADCHPYLHTGCPHSASSTCPWNPVDKRWWHTATSGEL